MATGFNYTLNASSIPVANYAGYTGPSGGNYIFWTVNANTIQSGGPTGVNATLVKNNLNVNGSVSGLSGTFSDLSIGTFATGYNSVNTTTGFTGSYGTTLNVAGSTLTSSLTFGDNSTTISGNLPIDYTTFGVTGWIQNTSVSNINCIGGICMSSSGQYQTVGTTLTVYVSSNYGQTWSSIPSISSPIYSVCMSSSGQYQLASSAGIIGIWYSYNYGQTWAKSNAPINLNWYSSAISSSGQYQSAVVNNGTIYYSTNYGQTWVSSNAPTSGWLGIAMSSLGRYQTAVSNSGDGVWYSTDFGKTWLKSFSLPMTCVAMSASGQYQTISSGGGSFIYNSTNYGLNWDVSNAPSSLYNDICMSSSGQYRMACVNGTIIPLLPAIYYSIDYGINWTPVSLSILASNNWYSICMSSSGQFQSVCINNSSGSIYTNGLYSSPIYGNISFQGPSTNSITTSGTATLSINSQGGALTLQSAGTTYASVTSSGIILPTGTPNIYVGTSTGTTKIKTNKGITMYGSTSNSDIESDGVANIYIKSSAISLSDTSGNPYISANVGGLTIGTSDSIYSTVGHNLNIISQAGAFNFFQGANVDIQFLRATNGASYPYIQINHPNGTVSGTVYEQYLYNNAIIGYVVQTSTTVASFVASSDYRLKRNPIPIHEPIEILQRLKPCKFTWIDDNIDDIGFIAHEYAEVFPNSVIGKKDGMNEDGTVKRQMMTDKSCIPLLVACVQKQQAEITDLKSQLASLKEKVDMLVSRI
jgi:hypothetical protein